MFSSSAHKVTITCPLCEHQQSEPKMAVSTICRSCQTGMKLEKGIVIFPKKKSTQPATFKEEKTNQTQPISSPEVKQLFPFRRQEQEEQKTNHLLTRFFHKTTEPRTVHCANCDKNHTTYQAALASHCPACGKYITLKDYQINDSFHRSIQTQGDVTILKKASLLGGVIECRNLTIDGPFRGSAKCSGTVEFLCDSRIHGHITCQHFIIAKHCKIEAAHPFITKTALIEGELHTSIVATGAVSIEKNAIIIGDILAASVNIKSGAKHKGLITIQSIAL